MNAPMLPLLDEQTEQELQPPCDQGSCDHPAAWVLRWRTTCECMRSIVLGCDGHTEKIRHVDGEIRAHVDWSWTCYHCGASAALISVVPL